MFPVVLMYNFDHVTPDLTRFNLGVFEFLSQRWGWGVGRMGGGGGEGGSYRPRESQL